MFGWIEWQGESIFMETKVRSQNWRQNGDSLDFGRDGFGFQGDIYGIVGWTSQKSAIPRIFTMYIMCVGV